MVPFWRRDGRTGQDQADGFAALFVHFRRIVTTNNRILELIADLERVLGGEYIFDRTFLKTSVSEIIDKGRQVIYHLNAMADDRYTGLYDRFTVTADHLADILAGGPGPYGPLLVLDWSILHRDLGHLAGNKGASLGEAANGLSLPVPTGFVVSTTGYRRFMEANNLFARIGEVVAGTDDRAQQAEAVARLFAEAEMPRDLAEAIDQALARIQTDEEQRFVVRSSGVDEDGERSFAGQFLSLLDVPAQWVADACVHVMASRFLEHTFHYLGGEVEVEASPMAVVVQPMIESRASGVLYTRDPNSPASETMVLSAVAGHGGELASGRDSGDRFVFDRHHPFHLHSSHLAVCRTEERLAGIDIMARDERGLRRGCGVIGPGVIGQMAEYGLMLEKRFEYPQDIEWCQDHDGTLWILQSRPLLLHLTPDDTHSPAEFASELARLPVLLSGRGHICQLGLAGGPVVMVDEDTAVDSFPVGAIAVSHFASPRLAEIVRRSAAIISDVGCPTSHLATIAREYRTPALFGTGNATAVLREGMEVMVDVEAKTVYQGRVELPAGLTPAEGISPLPPRDKEASILRRLLRLIAPLNLSDPSSPAFTVENCLTIHDFLRFCHEKAVAELIDFHVSGRVKAGANAPVLALELPIRIRVLDIGGGIKTPGIREIPPDEVNSRPLIAILRGLMDQDFWSQEPVPFGMRDLLSGITRPLLGNNPGYSGENLAIVSDQYCNLSLRLGYHFNIIDCYLSADSDDNYVYFRFAGGFAEPRKRRRRAEMIAQVLAGLYFKVEMKGDLVLGKVKMVEPEHMESILVHLGQLVAFTRQLDVKMADEEAVDTYFARFLEKIGQHGAGGDQCDAA